MPTTYNGVSTGLDVDTTASIAEPIGSDPPNAALFATPFHKLTNLVQNIQEKAGFLAKARTWTAVQTFSAGISLASLTLSGALSAASATISGAISAASASLGAITGTSLNVGTGAVTAGPVTSGKVTATGASASDVGVVAVGGSTSAPIRLTVRTSDPSTVTDGDMWVLNSTDTTGGTFRWRLVVRLKGANRVIHEWTDVIG